MVVILKGGAAFSLRGDQLNHANFNPAQTPHSAPASKSSVHENGASDGIEPGGHLGKVALYH